MIVAAALLTAEEFLDAYPEGYELDQGVPVETAMSRPRHGKICNEFAFAVTLWCKAMDCGHVMSNDCMVVVRRNPDTVRGPDVCYFSYQRLPKGQIAAGLLDVLPELAVEVKSPTDRWSDLNAKADEFPAAGVLVVVLIDPEVRAVSVRRSGELPVTLDNGDVLELPDLLPGFRMPVATLFGG